MAAARTIAEWVTTLELDDVPEAVRTDAKLHVLDAIGCGLAAHASGVAHEGRATMGEREGVPTTSVPPDGASALAGVRPTRAAIPRISSMNTSRSVGVSPRATSVVSARSYP